MRRRIVFPKTGLEAHKWPGGELSLKIVLHAGDEFAFLLEMVLLRVGVSGRTRFEFGSSSVVMTKSRESDSGFRPDAGHWEVQLDPESMDRVIVFFLAAYRDTEFPVDHVDIDVGPDEKDTLTIKVPCFRPPMDGAIARRMILDGAAPPGFETREPAVRGSAADATVAEEVMRDEHGDEVIEYRSCGNTELAFLAELLLLVYQLVNEVCLTLSDQRTLRISRTTNESRAILCTRSSSETSLELAENHLFPLVSYLLIAYRDRFPEAPFVDVGEISGEPSLRVRFSLPLQEVSISNRLRRMFGGAEAG